MERLVSVCVGALFHRIPAHARIAFGCHLLLAQVSTHSVPGACRYIKLDEHSYLGAFDGILNGTALVPHSYYIYVYYNFLLFQPRQFWWASLRAYWNDDIGNYHFMWIEFHLEWLYPGLQPWWWRESTQEKRSNEIFKMKKQSTAHFNKNERK